MRSEAQRRMDHEPSLASTRLAGHVPTPEFLADCERVIRGEMTPAEARAASLARALHLDELARLAGDSGQA